MPTLINLSDEQRAEATEWIVKHTKAHCLFTAPPDRPLLGKAPGAQVAWTLQMKMGMYNPTYLRFVALLMLDEMGQRYGDYEFQLAGCESAAVPLLTGISLVASAYGHDINVFSCRKERKPYGMFNYIEGQPNNKPIVFVDDVCSSGHSIRHAALVARSEHPNSKIKNDAFVIIKKEPIAEALDPMQDWNVMSIMSTNDLDVVE